MDYLIQPADIGWICTILENNGTETTLADESVIRLGQKIINHARVNANSQFGIFLKPDYNEQETIIHSEAQ